MNLMLIFSCRKVDALMTHCLLIKHRIVTCTWTGVSSMHFVFDSYNKVGRLSSWGHQFSGLIWSTIHESVRPTSRKCRTQSYCLLELSTAAPNVKGVLVNALKMILYKGKRMNCWMWGDDVWWQGHYFDASPALVIAWLWAWIEGVSLGRVSMTRPYSQSHRSCSWNN